jgi:hypothetical protein
MVPGGLATKNGRPRASAQITPIGAAAYLASLDRAADQNGGDEAATGSTPQRE